MPMRKNIKIASTKRGHHERNKRNFLKSKKQVIREKQTRDNTFKKRSSKIELQKKTIGRPKKKRNINNNESLNEKSSFLKVSDIYDMLEDSDKEGKLGEQNVHPVVVDSEVSSSSDDDANSESNESENEEMTEKLEQENIRNERSTSKNFKELLPIKTKSGVIPRSIETAAVGRKIHEISKESDDDNDSVRKNEPPPAKKKKVLTATELLGERKDEFNFQKYRIGKICSAITERPEERVSSFKSLLELGQEVNEQREKNLVSVRKLAMLSTMEAFKDIIPDYKIGITDTHSQKVKKDTLARVTFEKELLKYFKKYLCQLEACAKALKPGKYSKRPTKEEIYMAEIAVQCLCELLLAHTYSNYSNNIAQVLVIYLNCFNANARKRINETFIKLFKSDKRLDLSRHIVRNINHLVKKKSNSVFTEVISCLLALQIKSINPEAEKVEELKRKKMEQQKSKLISMSKRERKRKKKLVDLEKEMMETEAEENKQSRQGKLTDISKLVFTIYFRILKECPKSRLLSCTLEGLAKFAHIINVEFFSDLIEVLNHLIENAELGYREQLHCIQTVFAILSGQGEALNIDPARFYKHLYQNILSVNAGKNHEDVESIIVTLENVLIRRRKNITQLRYLAFLKRLLTLSLQLLQNGSLGCMGIVKNAMQLNSSLDILLDTENKIGSGKFDPAINDPEFCNSNCTSLFELTLLRRHYHSTVSKMANYILSGCQMGNIEPEISKQQPIEFYEKFNSNEMAFNPPIPPPLTAKEIIKSSKSSSDHITFKLKDLGEICTKKSFFKTDTKFNFFKEF